jgi:hypothetical protein
MQSLHKPLGILEGQNMLTRRDGENCPQGKEHQGLLRTDHPPGNSDLYILSRLFL